MSNRCRFFGSRFHNSRHVLTYAKSWQVLGPKTCQNLPRFDRGQNVAGMRLQSNVHSEAYDMIKTAFEKVIEKGRLEFVSFLHEAVFGNASDE
jgi:hypothetical protein